MGSCHPDDLPEGYHTAARGQSMDEAGGGGVEGCPRATARYDWRQVDGMALAGRWGRGAVQIAHFPTVDTSPAADRWRTQRSPPHHHAAVTGDGSAVVDDLPSSARARPGTTRSS